MAHASWDELQNRLAAAREAVPIGSMWELTKTRGLYRAIGHTIIEQTDQAGVKYCDLEHPDVPFTRPLNEWFELVDHGSGPQPRFIPYTDIR